MAPAMMAARPVIGPRQSKMPQTNATTAAVLAGGFSPRGNPVLGSIVTACMAMLWGEPVIGFGGQLGPGGGGGVKELGGAGAPGPQGPCPGGGGGYLPELACVHTKPP